MHLAPEAHYLQLGRLVADMPDFAGPAPIPAEVADLADCISFKVAAQGLTGVLRESNVQTIMTVVYGALARAELAAPLSAQGAFIQAGAEFDAFVAFGKILQTATSEVMIVDPYADEKALTDFAVQAIEAVLIRILADGEYRKSTLKPATERWQAQYGARRPLAVRLTPKKALHDRLIIVDNTVVWTFGQSLNAIAVRAHTSIVRVDSETSVLKVAAYEDLWTTATPI